MNIFRRKHNDWDDQDLEIPTPEQLLKQEVDSQKSEIERLSAELKNSQKQMSDSQKDIEREKHIRSAYFYAIAKYHAKLTSEQRHFNHTYFILSFRPGLKDLRGRPFLYKILPNGHGVELDNDSAKIITSLVEAFPLSHFYWSQTNAQLYREYENYHFMENIAQDRKGTQIELQAQVTKMLTTTAYQNIFKLSADSAAPEKKP